MRVSFVHTSSMLNLRGSERWVIDVCNLLGPKLSVRIINFDYDSILIGRKRDRARRYQIVKEMLGTTPLIELEALRLEAYPRRLHRSKLGRLVDKYLQFVPISWRFFQQIRRSDLVYFVQCQSEPTHLFFVLMISFLAGARPVIEGIHVVPRIRPSQAALLKLFYKIGTLRGVHTVNKLDSGLIRNLIGCPTSYIPNGVFLNRFAPRIEAKAQQRTFSILFVGAMTSNKGADLLPKIYSELKQLGLEFEFVLCTTGGPLVEQLQDWSKEVNNVVFKGFVEEEELLRIYAESSLVLLPSREEQFGFVSLEAQASGTPVVASSASGYGQTIMDGDSGFFVPEHTPEAFAEKVYELYEIWKADRTRYLRICRRARQNVEDNFQWKQIADQFGALFERAVQGETWAG